MNREKLQEVGKQMLAQYNHGESLKWAGFYGSAVFPPEQTSAKTALYKSALRKVFPKEPMVDAMFVVDDPRQWHRQNMKINSEEYTWYMRMLGPSFAGAIQEWGAGVYYHQFIRIREVLTKYGVMSKSSFIDDLENWSHLYFAGRLHKTIITMTEIVDREIEPALQKNLQAAVAVGRLMQGNRFTLKQLFTEISAISYSGDIRHKAGVDTNKYERIVRGNMAEFTRYYKPILEAAQFLDINFETGQCEQETAENGNARQYLLHQIPEIAREGISIDPNEQRIDSLQSALRDNCRRITGRSSLGTSAKNIITAGPWRSVRYVANKLGS